MEPKKTPDPNALDIQEIWGMDNIAEKMPETSASGDLSLNLIGRDVVDEYETDKESREQLERIWDLGHKLARMAPEKTNKPFIGATKPMSPKLQEAAVQYAARMLPQVIRGDRTCHAKVVGKDEGGKKKAQGERTATFQSYWTLNEIPDWEDSLDELLVRYSLDGSGFRKTFFDHGTGELRSDFVPAPDLVIDYWAKSLDTAQRITHVFYLTRRELEERMRDGTYLEVDLDKKPETTPEDATSGRAEDNPSADPNSEDPPHEILEQHKWLDLDDDGLDEPYVVTVHRTSMQTLRIVDRFKRIQRQTKTDEDGNKVEDPNGRIARVVPRHFFSRVILNPSPDGSIYGMGFCDMLVGLIEVYNSCMKIIMDASARASASTGLIDDRLKPKQGDEIVMSLGEYPRVTLPDGHPGQKISDYIYDSPAQPPHPTLFQFAETIAEAIDRVSYQTDVMSGQAPGPNTAGVTVMALIEQATQPYKATFKRMYRFLTEENKKIRDLIRENVTDEEYLNVIDDPLFEGYQLDPENPNALVQQEFSDETVDILPSADPNTVSNVERLQKARVLMENLGIGLQDHNIKVRLIEALEIEDSDEILPPEGQPTPPDPEVVEKMGRLDLDTAKFQQQVAADQDELALKRIETEVNLRKTLAEVEKINAEIATMSAEDDLLEMERQRDELAGQADQLKKVVQRQNEYTTQLEELSGLLGTQSRPADSMAGPRSNPVVSGPVAREAAGGPVRSGQGQLSAPGVV